MGSAACLQLAARGVSVIGIDQYAPPHPWGSTHGDTRVTRLAIGEGREYVPLVRRSHELWREIEAETGSRLMTRAGIVILAHPSSPFLQETRAAARQYAIDHEDLTGDEVRSRFPMFAIGEQTVAYYEPDAGYVRPEAAVAAQLDLARRRGAALRLGERVERWSKSDRGVTVTTDTDTYRARAVAPVRRRVDRRAVSRRPRDLRRVPAASPLVPDQTGVHPAPGHAGVRVRFRRRSARVRSPRRLLWIAGSRRP